MNLYVFNSFALAIRENGTYTPFSGESWAFAGQVTLLGMGMIFSVLAILWGVLAIFKLIFVGKSPKTPKKDDAKPIEKTVIAANVQAYEKDQTNNDTALIAVLTAAVAAYREEEGTEGGFRVVSFKRASSRAWNAKK